MAIVLAGINFKTASVELRERYSFSEAQAKETLRHLTGSGILQEAVLLSTCNRTEIYGVMPENQQLNGQLWRFFGDDPQSREELASHFYKRTNRHAVHHLFRVAAGLDSLVVGEAQILGQTKQAYIWATEAGSSGTFLNKLFHQAFRVGKRVRSETRLGAGHVSVGSVAVNLAEKLFRDFSGKKIALVGAGEMAQQVVRQLQSTGAKNIYLLNRTLERARELAESIDGLALPFDSLPEVLGFADILVTSTSAPQPIITVPMIREGMIRRKNRPLFLIDIAVPRNIEAAVRDIYNVFLYDIDDLKAVVERNLKEREKEIPKAEAIVTEETDRFMEWLESLDSIHTIQQLQQHFEAIRKREVERNKKFFKEEDWEQMELFSRSLLKKFLHSPIMRLKSCPESGHVCQRCSVKEVFGLEEEVCLEDEN